MADPPPAPPSQIPSEFYERTPAEIVDCSPMKCLTTKVPESLVVVKEHENLTIRRSEKKDEEERSVCGLRNGVGGRRVVIFM